MQVFKEDIHTTRIHLYIPYDDGFLDCIVLSIAQGHLRTIMMTMTMICCSTSSVVVVVFILSHRT